MKNGILVIDKEKDKTSREVVNELVKKFHTKKIGHTGTLDPLATGVLVVCVGQATKIIELLTSSEKEYIAEFVVGMTSDTLDVTGGVEEVNTEKYSPKEIEEVLKSFIGNYEQEVPKFSAVHVNGKRLYEYAREKEEVELPKRTVEIKTIEFLEAREEENHQVISFRVTVSKGTYIRSLIKDIGEKLGSPCIMKNLRRTRQGQFEISNAKKVEEIVEKDFVSLKEVFKNYPQEIVEDEGLLLKVRNGAKIRRDITDFICFLDKDENFLAIYKPDLKNEGWIRPWKVFPVSQNKI